MILNTLGKKTSIGNKGLYTQLLVASIFMFIVPLVLAFYLIFIVLFRQDVEATASYARLVVFWMVASGVVGFTIMKKPVQDLLALIRKAKTISEDGGGGKIEVHRENELKDLASAFNRITTDLEKKIEELEYSRSLTRELFQKISHAITSSQKLESLLALIGQGTRKVLRGEASFIALYDDGDGKMFLRAYSGQQKDLSEDMEVSDKKGVIGFVIKNKKPMIIKKAETEDGLRITVGEEIIKYTTILSVPIVEHNKVLGVIGVTNLADTERIETDDLFFMENIAGQVATSIENFRLNRDIEETYYQTLLTLAKVVEAKDTCSAGHLERVGKYVEMMADKLHLDPETKEALRGGAVLHDLGKVGIADSILKKQGKFTNEEFEIMKQHSIIGENILKPLRSMSKLSELVRHHHECYDGSGYPDGISGEDIPLSSRILTIADIYDALTTDRPYRKAMTKQETIKMLRSYAGTKVDPKLVEIFINILNEDTEKIVANHEPGQHNAEESNEP